MLLKKVRNGLIIIIIVIMLMTLSFLPVISVLVSCDDCDPENVYGMSSLFQRVMNPDCPKVWDVKELDYERQEYIYHANWIIHCGDVHWFYDR